MRTQPGLKSQRAFSTQRWIVSKGWHYRDHGGLVGESVQTCEKGPLAVNERGETGGIDSTRVWIGKTRGGGGHRPVLEDEWGSKGKGRGRALMPSLLWATPGDPVPLVSCASWFEDLHLSLGPVWGLGTHCRVGQCSEPGLRSPAWFMFVSRCLVLCPTSPSFSSSSARQPPHSAPFSLAASLQP